MDSLPRSFDAGRTQVESGSFTVFGIGPMANKKSGRSNQGL